jgi:hypothetical protein
MTDNDRFSRTNPFYDELERIGYAVILKREYDALADALAARDAACGHLEELCRLARPETIRLGAQDPDVGWLATSEPGYWLTLNGTSYIAPTIQGSIEAAHAATFKVTE